jgi:hypothetical protein
MTIAITKSRISKDAKHPERHPGKYPFLPLS